MFGLFYGFFCLFGGGGCLFCFVFSTVFATFILSSWLRKQLQQKTDGEPQLWSRWLQWLNEMPYTSGWGEQNFSFLFLEKSQLTETSIFPHTESTPDQPAGQPTVHVISQYGYTNVARRWGRWAKPRPPESKYSVLIATCPVLGYRVCVNHKEVSLGLQCRSKSDQSA